jgi:hypothetical protein
LVMGHRAWPRNLCRTEKNPIALVTSGKREILQIASNQSLP